MDICPPINKSINGHYFSPPPTPQLKIQPGNLPLRAYFWCRRLPPVLIFQMDVCPPLINPGLTQRRKKSTHWYYCHQKDKMLINNSMYINYNFLLKTSPTFASSVDPDQMVSEEEDTVCHAVCELNKNIKNLIG